MSASYRQLLDAAVQHLEGIKANGSRFVNVSPATLQSLRAAPQRLAPRIAPEVRAPMPQSAAAQPVSAASAQPVRAVVAPPSAVLTPATSGKAAALAEIRERALACVKCPHLVSTRKTVVFGVGNPEAELMFVGEAPGADEDIQGEPFVGAAGQLLTRMILAMGLTREQVYIANILKCRPNTPPGSSGNRPPTPEEMQTCTPFLHAQIDVMKPKVLVGLGATAVQGLLGKTAISKLRGNWHSYRDIPLMPTYHPAYLLRNQAMSEKRRVWEDLLAVMEKLNLPISEKQRNFFLASTNR